MKERYELNWVGEFHGVLRSFWYKVEMPSPSSPFDDYDDVKIEIKWAKLRGSFQGERLIYDVVVVSLTTKFK